ncbi:MAG TPA: hypothetical protein VH393_14245 [Ktedonobacterales bacterium]|jgi:hypothetical protein
MIGAEDAGASLLLLLLITIACVAAVVHFIRIPYTVASSWRDSRSRSCPTLPSSP